MRFLSTNATHTFFLAAEYLRNPWNWRDARVVWWVACNFPCILFVRSFVLEENNTTKPAAKYSSLLVFVNLGLISGISLFSPVWKTWFRTVTCLKNENFLDEQIFYFSCFCWLYSYHYAISGFLLTLLFEFMR